MGSLSHYSSLNQVKGLAHGLVLGQYYYYVCVCDYKKYTYYKNVTAIVSEYELF